MYMSAATTDSTKVRKSRQKAVSMSRSSWTGGSINICMHYLHSYIIILTSLLYQGISDKQQTCGILCF
jgi:hypothetical protein